MNAPAKPRRPRKQTVARVVAWLQDELDLTVTGQCIDLDAGITYDSLMNYDAEAIEKLAKHLKRGTLTHHSEHLP